ncbi:PASTA domain-containing protein [Nocardioides convexus]|uniref:PASTA domain-containing protein n=1 Tax=Nocardioides convexus TaxID=2712224 RepID=UPI002418A32B|nr:PASTA domain-containing protein [Nocardioides convexus]
MPRARPPRARPRSTSPRRRCASAGAGAAWPSPRSWWCSSRPWPRGATGSAGAATPPRPAWSAWPRPRRRARLDDAGLGNKVEQVYSDNVAPGVVVSTDPRPGDRVLPGDDVTLTVSRGPEVYDVPDLAGLTVDRAEAKAGRGQDGAGPPGAALLRDRAPGAGHRQAPRRTAARSPRACPSTPPSRSW